jgi:hypothetical protein
VLKVSSYEQEFFTKFKHYLDTPTTQNSTKAFRFLDVLDDAFASSWIYARHLALILECFVHYGRYKQTKYFGTFRVELIILLFGRVIDLHNFDLVVGNYSFYDFYLCFHKFSVFLFVYDL